MKKYILSTLALLATLVSGEALAQLTPPPSTGARAPGLYVVVLDGLINLTNPAGATSFSTGQFGYTPNFRQPPVLLPVNPGKPFTPPPAFNIPTSTSGSSTVPGKSNTVDCEVR